jgi:uncharacterized protein (DUF1697 family)
MTGHNSIKMTDLTDLYRSLGFNDAETYIQSGNVIFSSDGKTNSSADSVKIEKGILERFGYKVPVMIRTLPEMEDLFTSNPFLNEVGFDPAKMAAIFLHEKPSDAGLQKVITVDYPPDKFKIVGKEIFIYCPNGFGKTKLYTNFFEKKMDVTGTARNWKTITTILDLAKKK